MAARDHDAGPPVIELLEEAVHLLRSQPGDVAVYYLATGPFALGFLYFWGYVSWFDPSDGAIAWGAILLVVLFGLMKVGQRHFVQRLLARRLEREPPAFAWRRLPANLATQFRVQGPGVVAVPLMLVATIPFGWIYAYFQSALAVPEDGPDGAAGARREAWKMAILWPGQNHRGLLIITVLWLAVFENIAIAFYFLPALGTRLLGLHTIFEHSGWMLLNTTFLFLMASLTHLLVDPLVKAFYVLRVFYGRSRRRGDEVRVALAREPKTWRRAAIAVLLLACTAGLAPARLRAAEPPVPAATPTAELDRALDRALAQPDFRWRLRPMPLPAEHQHKGMLAEFFESAADTLTEMCRAVGRSIGRFVDWLNGLMPKAKEPALPASAGGGGSTEWMVVLQMVAYALLSIVVVVLVVVALNIFRLRRQPMMTASAGGVEEAPDLRDENVQASRLPADGWLDLARQQMAAGEWRLALRALFLATLARLAEQQLLTLARHKTNLEYERELRRRAHSRVEIVTDFHGRRRSFEEVWYGRQPALAAEVSGWLAKLEGKP
ncbi:MAG TPA: DUF4129 domain-containing protein [Candidatus Didemnitutus sp.]|jgi:hypothetical protein